MVRPVVLLVPTLFLCIAAPCQPVGAPEFEVASVKPSPAPDAPGAIVGCTGGPGSNDPGMISCRNLSLTVLLSMAYRMSYDQMTVPDWMGEAKFDIAARVPAGVTKDQVPQMWQSLLADRFKLVVHREPKVVTHYELVV